MSHSKMLTTRRTKQRHQKELAGIAKRAKKRKPEVNKTGALAVKKESA